MPSKSRSWAKTKARNKNYAWVNPFKSNTGCKVCGLKHPNPKLFDFHHVDPDDKYKTKKGNIVHIADMMHYGFDTLIKEIIKCIVVCKCCHVLIEEGELNGTTN
jgi:hypothetical protein|tara:strand:+ start:372 stop:683 length:312 start_codon:yes stop_codon:yes gene_type:complete